jgi:hypothetical protein
METVHQRSQREARERKRAKAEQRRADEVSEARRKERAIYQTECAIDKRDLLALLMEKGYLPADTESLVSVLYTAEGFVIYAMRQESVL